MRLYWNDRMAALAARAGRWRLYPIVERVLIVALAAQTARLLWAILTPITPLNDWQPPIPIAPPPAARDALFARIDPFFRTQPIAAGVAPAPTALPLKLHGTRIGVAGGGAAIISGADGKQNRFRIGETVMDGVTLSAVAFDHVTLDRAGTKEKLFIDPPPAPPPAAAPSSVLPTAPAPAPGANMTPINSPSPINAPAASNTSAPINAPSPPPPTSRTTSEPPLVR